LSKSCQEHNDPKDLTIQLASRIKRPGLQTGNQQRSSTKKKNDRGITAHPLNLHIMYRVRCTFTLF